MSIDSLWVGNMTMMKRESKLTFWIFTALLLGLFTGLFFGEGASVLKVVGDIYIGLMQMAVLPFVFFSVILAIGRLDYLQIKRVLIAGGAFFLLFYVIAASVVFVVSSSFPFTTTQHYLEQLQLPQGEVLDLFKLFIPANPFRALAENSVPAVVIFSLFFGFAIIVLPKKQDLLIPLSVVVDGFKRVNELVVHLTPIGIFSMMANLAGTMTFDDFIRLQSYYLTFGFSVLFLSFGVFPALVATLTPLTYKEVLGATRNTMLTALVTGSVFPVMPLLLDSTKNILSRLNKVSSPQKVTKKDSGSEMSEILLPLAYPFPSSDSVVDLIFIPFAAWFVGKTLSFLDCFTIVGSGFFLLFGKVYLTIPFLLNYFNLPENMFQVFLGSGILASRIGSMLGPMHYFAFVILTGSYLQGQLRLKWKRILPLLTGLIGILFLGAITLSWWIQRVETATVSLKRPGDQQMESLPTGFQIIEESFPNPRKLEAQKSRLDRIYKHKILRIGYRGDQRPFAYWNTQGELVGLDVDLVKILAKELDLFIEFVPYELSTLQEQLAEDHFDFAIGGLQDAFSLSTIYRRTAPYLSGQLVLVSKNRYSERVVDLEKIKVGTKERWAMDVEERTVVDILRPYELPHLSPMTSVGPFFGASNMGFSGLITNELTAFAWLRLMPKYNLVPFKGLSRSVPFSWMVPGSDLDLLLFLNEWLEIKKQDQTMDRLKQFWVFGKAVESTPKRRWSIWEDVLRP